MKTLTIIAAMLAFSAGLSACTSTPTQTPAQLAAQICPAAQAVTSGLLADVGLPQGVLQPLAQFQPTLNTTCVAASTITSADLTTLENFAIQTLLPAAQAYNPKLAADLLAVQVILDVYNAQHPAAPASTTAATAASATISATTSAK